MEQIIYCIQEGLNDTICEYYGEIDLNEMEIDPKIKCCVSKCSFSSDKKDNFNKCFDCKQYCCRHHSHYPLNGYDTDHTYLNTEDYEDEPLCYDCQYFVDK